LQAIVQKEEAGIKKIRSEVEKAACWVGIYWAYRRWLGTSVFAVHDLASLCKLACTIEHKRANLATYTLHVKLKVRCGSMSTCSSRGLLIYHKIPGSWARCDWILATAFTSPKNNVEAVLRRKLPIVVPYSQTYLGTQCLLQSLVCLSLPSSQSSPRIMSTL